MYVGIAWVDLEFFPLFFLKRERDDLAQAFRHLLRTQLCHLQCILLFSRWTFMHFISYCVHLYEDSTG